MPELEQSPHVVLDAQPELDSPLMLAAWTGWSDAGECATLALREIVVQLNARQFATLDPEPFYIFTQERPTVRNAGDGGRVLDWPANRLYYWKSPDDAASDLVFLIGAEPHLKWRTYTAAIAHTADAVGVQLLATVGALLDSVPHTRAPRVLCTTVDRDLPGRFNHVQYPRPNYEGPSGMTSATIDAVAQRGIKAVSIWGHAPHYLQVKRNPAITLAIVDEICRLSGINVDRSRLEQEADEFEQTVARAIEGQSEITSYVERLEEQYDSEQIAAEDAVSGDIVQQLDDYLRNRDANGTDA